MRYGYLNAENDVIASSTIERTLVEAQAKNSDVVSILTDIPVAVIVKGLGTAEYHRHTSGDGTDISHYTTVETTDDELYASDPKQVAIHDFMARADLNNDVRTIDYRTGLVDRLHKVITTVHLGEVRRVDYYADTDATRRVLAVEVFADEELTTPGYSRNSLGSPLERWTRRVWYRRDGSVFATKVTHKIYTHDPAAQMREGIRRRTNVVDKLSVDVLTAYAVTTAANPAAPTLEEMAAAYDVVTAYMDKYEGGVTTFIRVGRHDFTEPPESPNITDDTDTWLDSSVVLLGYPTGWTIRTIMLESLKNISETG